MFIAKDLEDAWVLSYRHSAYRRQMLDEARKLARHRAEVSKDDAEKRRWAEEMHRLLLLQEQAGTPVTPDPPPSG